MSGEELMPNSANSPRSSKSPFPSALQRRHGGEPDITPKRREPSAAKLAMMSADQLRDYYKRKGEWAEPDLEAIAEARRQNDYSR